MSEQGTPTPYDLGQREGFRRALEGEAPWWQIPGNPDGEYRGDRVAGRQPAVTTTADVQLNLIDKATARSFRVLCWTVTIILWAWLVLGGAAVFAFAAGVASNPKP